MSSLLATALGRSGKKAGRVSATTDDPAKPDGMGEEDEVAAAADEADPDAEGEEEEVAAAADDPDPDAEGDDEDYTAADEETEEEMAASMRGASRVLAIVGSTAGRANPNAALKAAGMHKLTAAEAIDMIGVAPKAEANAQPSARKNRLNAKLAGKAKGLGPDAVKPAKPVDAIKQAGAARSQKLTNQWKAPLNATKGDR